MNMPNPTPLDEHRQLIRDAITTLEQSGVDDQLTVQLLHTLRGPAEDGEWPYSEAFRVGLAREVLAGEWP